MGEASHPGPCRDTVEKRVERAEALISMGEISVARHALEGSPVAPGNEDTLNALRDEDRHPPVPREEIFRAVPARPFQLDKDEFLYCLRTARRGAAGEPTGMKTEHLRPLLDNDDDCNMFHEVAQSFAQDSIAKAEWRSAGNCCW